MNPEKGNLNPSENLDSPGLEEEENLDTATPENIFTKEESAAVYKHAKKIAAEDTANLAKQRETMGLEQPELDAPENNVEQEGIIESTASFNEATESKEGLADGIFSNAIDSGDFTTAGEWLFTNRTKIKHDVGQEFLDRASGKLFEELLKSGNLDLAASMISMHDNDEVRQNMRSKLAQTRQAKGQETETPENNVEQEGIIESTASFNEAVDEGRLEEAAAWLMIAKEKPNYDARWADHRSKKIFDKARESKNWSLAKQMVELGNGEDAKTGRKGALEKLLKEEGLSYDQI